MDLDAFRDPPGWTRPRQRLIALRTRAGLAPTTPHSLAPLEDVADVKALGFGRVTVQLPEKDYLDDAAGWAALREQLLAIRAHGMTAMIRDERGRPSGKAAGKAVARNPRGAALGLAQVSQAFEGPCTARLALPEGHVVLAAALPRRDNRVVLEEARDLSRNAEAGEVAAELTDGQWLVMACVERRLLAGTFANDPTSGPEPYINIMDRQAVAAWIAESHDAHARHLGDLFGSVVEGFHSDEPLLVTTAFPSGREAPPWPILPWADELSSFFQMRAGYALQPCLPALFHDAGPDTAAIRCDFWRIVGELCGDAFRAQLGAWHAAHGITHKLQALGEESFVTQTAFNGSASGFVGDAALPCADILSVTPETFRSRDQCIPAARMIASAALHNGVRELEVDMADAYQYRAGIATTLEDLRATIAFTHVMGGTALQSLCAWKERAPGEWRALTDFAARLRLALAGTDHLAEIGLVGPELSVWANYVPGTGYIMEPPIGGLDRPRIWSETYAAGASRWDIAFRDLLWTLLEAQRDAGIIAASDLRRGQIRGDEFLLGAASYRALLLPPADTADPEAIAAMLRFAKAGGVVGAFHPWPHRAGRRSGAAREAAIALFGSEVPARQGFVRRTVGAGVALLAADTEGMLRALDANLPASVAISCPAPELLVARRRSGEGVVCLLANLGHGAIIGQVSLRGVQGIVHICDPTAGDVRSTTAAPDGISVQLPGRSAIILHVPSL